MRTEQELAAELEALVSRYGLVRVTDAFTALFADRAERIGEALRREHAAGGLGSIVRRLGQYVIERQRKAP
jgi:hypothetical protein